MTTVRWRGPWARWLLLAAGIAAMCTSCGVRPAAANPAQPPGSSALISGVVVARPGCPVQGRHESFCRPRRLGGVRVEARALPAGVTAATRTRADGRYALRLRRGRYVLAAVTGQVLPRCPHVLVSVTPPAPVRININCDSGIR